MGLEKIANEEAEKLQTANLRKRFGLFSKITYTIGIIIGVGTGFAVYTLTNSALAGTAIGAAMASPLMYSGYDQGKMCKLI